jgi:hypothetical protein
MTHTPKAYQHIILKLQHRNKIERNREVSQKKGHFADRETKNYRDFLTETVYVATMRDPCNMLGSGGKSNPISTSRKKNIFQNTS